MLRAGVDFNLGRDAGGIAGFAQSVLSLRIAHVVVLGDRDQ
jgi:hypothetical protein